MKGYMQTFSLRDMFLLCRIRKEVSVNQNKNSFLMPLIFAIVLAFGVLIGTKIGPAVNSKPQYTAKGDNALIREVMGYIKEQYVDTVNIDSIVNLMTQNYLNSPSTIDSIVKFLDPHSSYIHKEDLQSFNEDLEGNFEGVGIEFNIINDTILVVAALTGGPSEKVGIMPGDKIIKINDSLVAGNGITNEKVMTKLRGEKGTHVDVAIYRKGVPGLLDFDIRRAEIPVLSIDASYMADSVTGYIKINKFSKDTPLELDEALNKLLGQGMQKLILDLRGNPGGFLSDAVDMADEFLPDHKLIVYTQGRAVGRHDYFAEKNGLFETGRMEVLINEYSASASEILAGALKDNGRATIIGRRSFGKGLVQQVYPLPDSSALRLTIARYYTPDGRCIQRPYDQGVDAYYQEYLEILENGGELPDSLKKNDKTDWGIHPDIWVSVDTTPDVEFFNVLFNKGYIQQFTYSHYSENPAVYDTYKSLDDFEKNFSVSDDLYREFIRYAAKRDSSVRASDPEFAGAQKRISLAIEAFIARQKWGNDGFYTFLNKFDDTYQVALKHIEMQ